MFDIVCMNVIVDIIVVDDDISICDVFVECLEGYGFCVCVVVDV